MSVVELSVSDELGEWSVTEFGLLDFRAMRVFLSSTLVDTPTAGVLFNPSRDWRGLRRLVGLSAVE